MAYNIVHKLTSTNHFVYVCLPTYASRRSSELICSVEPLRPLFSFNPDSDSNPSWLAALCADLPVCFFSFDCFRIVTWLSLHSSVMIHWSPAAALSSYNTRNSIGQHGVCGDNVSSGNNCLIAAEIIARLKWPSCERRWQLCWPFVQWLRLGLSLFSNGCYTIWLVVQFRYQSSSPVSLSLHCRHTAVSLQNSN